MIPGETPLTGWKAIADDLKVSVRTAMYWGDKGMPVFKILGRVAAMKSEIVQWLENRKHHVAYKPIKRPRAA